MEGERENTEGEGGDMAGHWRRGKIGVGDVKEEEWEETSGPLVALWEGRMEIMGIGVVTQHNDITILSLEKTCWYSNGLRCMRKGKG